MSPTPTRPSALSPFDSATSRQSPFRRQNSTSPATVRASTPSPSPTKPSSNLSLNKAGSLSPEKASPFVRRPSQLGAGLAERPASPFARPSSSLSVQSSPSRNVSDSGRNTLPAPLSPTRQSSNSPAEDTPTATPAPLYGLDGNAKIWHPAQPSLRPALPRTTTASSTATIKQPLFAPKPPAPTLNPIGSGGAYTHIPHPLLHSMRESFEVLDGANTGLLTPASITEMLSQLGLDAHPSSLKNFFPPNGQGQMNLARYLDTLSGPLAELSQPDELRAAFEAFDVDDSGQIDVSLLREALLGTAPQPGEEMLQLSEREVEGILGEFAGRRAFGAKGLNAAGHKGDVFRYREFMANVNGGGAGAVGGEGGVAA